MSFFSFFFPLSWVQSGLGGLPAPNSLSYYWNFGSFLGIILSVQLLSGVFLSISYTGESSLAFESVILLSRESFFGFFLRWFHLNTASLFFLILYAHILRGLLFSSFRLFLPWSSGSSVLILLIGTAFLGYVLPWGQISLWGATVITNLLSTIPIVGEVLVVWVWGGFSVGSPTLSCFYSLHFLLPFFISFIVFFHIVFLHETGSSSNLSLFSHESNINFHPLFSLNDSINLLFGLIFLLLVFLSPFNLGDPENFNLANFLASPLHIQPEWYFLCAYAVLRSIPNKLGGVVGLVLSVANLFLLPFISQSNNSGSKSSSLVVWAFFLSAVVLTWIGGNPVEAPFVLIGQLFTFCYFLFLFLLCFLCFSI